MREKTYRRPVTRGEIASGTSGSWKNRGRYRRYPFFHRPYREKIGAELAQFAGILAQFRR